jgi:predicted TIM-barrel fold metal-dependent hydrolase
MMIPAMKTLFVFLLLLAATLHAAGCQADEPAGLYFVDAHSQVDHKVSGIDAVLARMAANNVKATLLSTREKRQWREILQWNANHPDRIIPLVRSKGTAYQDKTPAYFASLHSQSATGRFSGVAEILIYHARKGNKAPEVNVDLTDERVSALLKMALSNDWPFIIHIEFAALSAVEKSRQMASLRNLLAGYPAQPFALIHMGQLQPDEVAKLLHQHSNLYFIASHTNPPAISQSTQPWVNIFDGHGFKQEWKSLFIKYPDKFIFALDNVWADHWGPIYDKKMQLWKSALAELPPDVSHRIAHGNAERVWRLKK